MEKWRKTVFYRLSVVLAVCQPAASQPGLFIAVDRKRTAASRAAWDRVGLHHNSHAGGSNDNRVCVIATLSCLYHTPATRRPLNKYSQL